MDDQFDRAVAEAISHIGINRAYSSGKIRYYLIRKGYDDSTADAVVASLIKRDYIDDMRAARNVLYQRTGKRRESRMYSFRRLLDAGIGESSAERYLDELPSDEDAFFELMDASFSDSDIDALDFNKKAHTVAARRGFSFEFVQNALRKWVNNRHK